MASCTELASVVIVMSQLILQTSLDNYASNLQTWDWNCCVDSLPKKGGPLFLPKSQHREDIRDVTAQTVSLPRSVSTGMTWIWCNRTKSSQSVIG